jgi:hypothetical protein
MKHRDTGGRRARQRREMVADFVEMVRRIGDASEAVIWQEGQLHAVIETLEGDMRVHIQRIRSWEREGWIRLIRRDRARGEYAVMVEAEEVA